MSRGRHPEPHQKAADRAEARAQRERDRLAEQARRTEFEAANRSTPEEGQN